MNDTFFFKDYSFDPVKKDITLVYGYDALTFFETYHFDFDFVAYDKTMLDRAIQQLFFIAGVSYYKIYAPQTIEVIKGEIDEYTAAFLSQTYEKGLGEFFYVNNLDPRTKVLFPTNTAALPTIEHQNGKGLLVGVGGGKDSLVSIELLRDKIDKLATWSVNHRSQLTPLIERVGLPHYWVERQWDPQLSELNKQPGTYNGHIPISAIFASVGTIVAILAGFRDVVVSNEQSANEPTLNYQGVPINHQYSKSQEFETSYQKLLEHNFSDSIRYYSFLRPLSELRIAEIFSRVGFGKYKDVFCSCNRAFTHDSNRMSWDGTCAKCAFVFLALTPFIEREKIEDVFHGKNLLLNPDLKPMYRQLLGIEGDKPLDCVGEIKESRVAMRLAQQQYPELDEYTFDIPGDYDYRAVASHAMPEELMLKELYS